jgi:2-phosphosulfolactate phosphatase
VKAQVYFTPGEVDPAAVQSATVVVVDVVRATTTMVEALANGARAIYPTASTEEAVKLLSSLGRDDTLLCGERKGVKVEGFDLGNSPSEFSRQVVEGKRIVMSTTNGTVALAHAQEARRMLACAFTNLGAVAEAVREEEELVVLCAGRLGRFSLDDAVCAGHLLKRLGVDAEESIHNDATRAVLALGGAIEAGRAFLAGTEAGRALAAIGLDGDLDLCGDVDRHAVVAEMRDRALIAAAR